MVYLLSSRKILKYTEKERMQNFILTDEFILTISLESVWLHGIEVKLLSSLFRVPKAQAKTKPVSEGWTHIELLICHDAQTQSCFQDVLSHSHPSPQQK